MDGIGHPGRRLAFALLRRVSPRAGMHDADGVWNGNGPLISAGMNDADGVWNENGPLVSGGNLDSEIVRAAGLSPVTNRCAWGGNPRAP